MSIRVRQTIPFGLFDEPRFHLKCIKSWVRRCNSAGGLEFNWACPGCRYNWVDRMPEYTCYCKKVPEPELNPHWWAMLIKQQLCVARSTPMPRIVSSWTLSTLHSGLSLRHVELLETKLHDTLGWADLAAVIVVWRSTAMVLWQHVWPCFELRLTAQREII
ncbi:unnamed protein product, partial [Effrenium voratum]